ncbi:MAG: hypothetical protein HC876_19405 [Chloroflexaceae bacterium]|nr:hypothetical protein [Chloroflexaceae bacterium]
MLSHPSGGMLAVISHVERAWGYSFLYEGVPQLNTFKELFQYLLLEGQPIGAAMEWFSLRFAETATDLTSELHDLKIPGLGKRVNEAKLARLWTTHNDARGYVIIGDPAVHLNVAGLGSNRATRPTLEAFTAGASGVVQRAAVVDEPPPWAAASPPPATSAAAPPAAGVQSGLPAALERAVQAAGAVLKQGAGAGLDEASFDMQPVTALDDQTVQVVMQQTDGNWELEVTVRMRKQ